MSVSQSSHARSHSILLLQRLLNLRDGASPLTLVLDNLEQTAGPLLREYMTRAKISRTKVILVSFATLNKPIGVDILIKAYNKELKLVQQELNSHSPAPGPSQKDKPAQRALIIIDSLNNLAWSSADSLASFLSRLITPVVSVVAVYHTDVPVSISPSTNEYEPAPLTLLTHLATAILRVSSLEQEIARQAARNRALQEPEWGLGEGREGVLIGLRTTQERALVVRMELRRRSGRSVPGDFILAPGTNSAPGAVSLLTDHAAFTAPEDENPQGEEPESTFNLGLTEKQRKDREGIVLPYFDAQTDIGAGQGGRILYDMGREDDFDEDEDEI
ncbi:hypothetical protein CDD81_8018 [Ophiocordyceps australis]|uniref:Elongator complex protein 5 n=1 Tax=Ophiocordyceps australis TaxID=1399860 RepID=A0A2C5Y228_9HYPO|nr:hypothetical protein CDD81_8018 [Ophiocordyceps australis]